MIEVEEAWLVRTNLMQAYAAKTCFCVLPDRREGRLKVGTADDPLGHLFLGNHLNSLLKVMGLGQFWK